MVRLYPIYRRRRNGSLTTLMITGTKVSDLSPLHGNEFDDFRFTPTNITRGLDVIRQMKSLKTIRLS